jgi:galactose mutarotase-like enzyme
VGARTRWLLSENKIPTGHTEPIERTFPQPREVPLEDYDLDHVFSDLIRDGDDVATMSVWSSKHRIDVELGASYRAAVVFAPKAPPLLPDGQPVRGDFVCLEPMAGITDALNLAHRRIYRELQYIAAGGTWSETFRIRARGF